MTSVTRSARKKSSKDKAAEVEKTKASLKPVATKPTKKASGPATKAKKKASGPARTFYSKPTEVEGSDTDEDVLKYEVKTVEKATDAETSNVCFMHVTLTHTFSKLFSIYENFSLHSISY